ncbi:conserved Plasmodium protein, unknown function [Plasmodium knowlesi strain H]|uniref:Kelch domain-containing protein n=3 Tax=Plasmodium knowlesi TaxID=5850 RepID=A0A5K1UDD2_PLAKH|nr:conserved Plasmodium protein, unknown function [Plasmodium knowlesi strain H]OTN66769.1 Uncharacterized protein PKNOH_S08482200 [Plasmodium knowlesi]CAA9990146.1 conserved Plasmodium protein, unknown function [Plasmodium knowlesi strain H]SBO25835.1 conserved Plasmodium protein, unknown function [Plasmodium knowlesi strain H]SBO28619.1 conserved Plasmodium protein, unknown function [Plasmodium knowlesi strain H]VVS79620.1 conserved Plasmodium protein, unknown function [Plasmodium knowlesi s|eukprot:XP_002260613.1 hypothetical protein, conserved in Plasmodium species [Plasmodium knowlesi strain H]
MSLTLFANDKRREYLSSNRPEGRVGHSLHHYYELSATEDVSGSSGRDDDEETDQTSSAHRMDGAYSYGIKSRFISSQEESKYGRAEIDDKKCGDGAEGELQEGGESPEGNPEEAYKGDKLFTQYPITGNHYQHHDDNLGSMSYGDKSGYHNRFIHGRYKVVLFGGGLPEEEFLKSYANRCEQDKGDDEDGVYSKYNTMSVENSLRKTFNDVYICEEENDDFENWVKVKTHNVPEGRAFHASCIVNLGINGVFLFIHGGKVKNDMLADDRLCALNLSRTLYRGGRSRSGSKCSEEPEGKDESNTSDSPMVEENNKPNRQEYNYHPDEYEEEHLPDGTTVRENQHGPANNAVVREHRNDKDKEGEPPNEGPQNGLVKKEKQEEVHEEERTFSEPLIDGGKNCDTPGGEKKWSNSNHHDEDGNIDGDIGATRLKEENCSDAKLDAARERAPPHENNVVANQKKRKLSCSSSHLCSASSGSASSESASGGFVSPSSSSSSSNSLPPCDSAFFRSKYYRTRDNQFDEEDENVLVNSRVPVKSLLFRGKDSSSCGSVSSDVDSDMDEEKNEYYSSLRGVKRAWVHIQAVGRKPSSRYGHTLDFLYPHIVLFGGNENVCDDERTFFCKNDLWVLNIRKGKIKRTNCQRKRIVYFQWEEIEYQSVDPLGRYFHATTVWYDVENKMNNLILYGGKMRKKTSISSRLLVLQNCGNVWRWSILPVYVNPLNENRACHALVCVHNHIFIIGGEDYMYRYIEKMPSALYSFESKRFQYINDFSAKACLKCFAKNETIYSWGGFTDISCNQIFLPNNFVTIDVYPNVMYIQMKEELTAECDENSKLVLKEEPDSDDDIYNRMNKKILKIHNRKIELEKDLLYQIKLNDNLNFRIKSQMVQYQRLVQLLNVKQSQNAHLINALTHQSRLLDGGSIGVNIGGSVGVNIGGSVGVNIGGNVGVNIGGSVDGCHVPSHTLSSGIPYDVPPSVHQIAPHGSYHGLHDVPLYEGNININMESSNHNMDNVNVNICNYAHYKNEEDHFKMPINERDNFTHPMTAEKMNVHASGVYSEYQCSVVPDNLEAKQIVSDLPLEDADAYKNLMSNEKGNKNVEDQLQLQLPFEGGGAPHHPDVPLNQVNTAGGNPPCRGEYPPPSEQVTNNTGSAPYQTFSGMSKSCATNGEQIPWNEHTSGYPNGAGHPSFSEMNQPPEMPIKNSSSFVNDYCMGVPLDVPTNNLQGSGSNDRIGNPVSTQDGIIGNGNEGSAITGTNSESVQAPSEGNCTNREGSNQRVRRKTAAKCLELIEQDRLSRMMNEK